MFVLLSILFEVAVETYRLWLEKQKKCVKKIINGVKNNRNISELLSENLRGLFSRWSKNILRIRKIYALVYKYIRYTYTIQHKILVSLFNILPSLGPKKKLDGSIYIKYMFNAWRTYFGVTSITRNYAHVLKYWLVCYYILWVWTHKKAKVDTWHNVTKKKHACLYVVRLQICKFVFSLFCIDMEKTPTRKSLKCIYG